MAILGPVSVAYPVAFRSGGDTTKEAFGKHIQEIEKIYGILNALDADKIAASEFTTKFNALDGRISSVQSTLQSNLDSHINSSNPHPNWKVDLGSQITGSLSGSKVSGDLPNATIDKGKVTGLEAYVKGLVNEDFYCPGDHAYANFPGGLQIRAGWESIAQIDNYETAQRQVNFAKAFTNHSLCVVLTIKNKDGKVDADWEPMLVEENKAYFTYMMNHVEENGYVTTNLEIHYIAIGH